jgi:tRNA G10  N-methylase Trm11
MQYFFILGRNPKLSYAEVYSYLESRGIKFTNILFEQNILIISTESELKIDIQELGGTMMCGKIAFSGNDKGFEKYIEDFFMPEEKFTYSVMGNFVDEVEESLMTKFKKEKLKAQVRRSHTRLKLQEGEEFAIPKADAQFISYLIDNKIYFGRIEQEYSHKEVKDRDMKKPMRRESLAISPRLAKILINLSQVKPGQLLLDPFCGVGGIIQEALLKDINCFGCDKDREAIIGARKNLTWLQENYKIKANYRLLNADSKTLPQLNVNGVATEPALGELIRRKLDANEAKYFISDFEDLIVPILSRISQIKNKGAKIVLTMPSVKSISVNLDKICNLTGLRIYEIPGIETPIKEFREDQYVSRDIVVLE